jgi:cell volume regulation protein A
MPIEYLITAAASLLLVSVLASKASEKLGVPALLLFLGVGMLAGSDGLGGIEFDSPWLAQSLGVVALALILFAGGVSTNWADVRPVLWYSLGLSTVGVLVTAVLVGWFATSVLGFNWLTGLLLGSIVSSTDAAAVFSVLRSSNVSLKPPLRPLLELESGSNDPMAVFLTTALIGLLSNPGAPVAGLVPMFVQQMALGAAIGYAMGKLLIFTINRLRLDYEGLYAPLTVSLVLLTYGVAALVGGNGFLAVYAAGIVAGNSHVIHKNSMVRLHDGLAWLMQIAMFLTLGLQVFPSRLPAAAPVALAITAFLMLVARPVAVILTLAPTGLDFRQKLMVSWIGLRGAVPIVLATFPQLAGVPQASAIFDVVFFIVLTSALLQGASIPWVARRLGVDWPEPPPPRAPLEFVPSRDTTSDMFEITISSGSPVAGRRIFELGLPKQTLITLINRRGQFLVPSGGTAIEAGDKLLLLADREAVAATRAALGG